VKQLASFCNSLKGLAKSKQLGMRAEANRYAVQAVAAVTATYDIQQRALVLRDAAKG